MKGMNESILQIIFKGHKSISFIDYKNNTSASEKLQAIQNSFGVLFNFVQNEINF